MYNYNYKNPMYMLGTVASLVLWLTIGVIAIADNTVWWYLAASLFTGVYARCHADIRYYAGGTPIRPYYQWRKRLKNSPVRDQLWRAMHRIHKKSWCFVEHTLLPMLENPRTREATIEILVALDSGDSPDDVDVAIDALTSLQDKKRISVKDEINRIVDSEFNMDRLLSESIPTQLDLPDNQPQVPAEDSASTESTKNLMGRWLTFKK